MTIMTSSHATIRPAHNQSSEYNNTIISTKQSSHMTTHDITPSNSTRLLLAISTKVSSGSRSNPLRLAWHVYDIEPSGSAQYWPSLGASKHSIGQIRFHW